MMKIWIDGSTINGNPGDSGVGVYAELTGPDGSVSKYEGCMYVGSDTTNNYAEAKALHQACDLIKQMDSPPKTTIYTDSMCVWHWTRNGGKCGSKVADKTKKAVRQAIDLLQELWRRQLDITVVHVKRELNEAADALSKEGSAGGYRQEWIA